MRNWVLNNLLIDIQLLIQLGNSQEENQVVNTCTRDTSDEHLGSERPSNRDLDCDPAEQQTTLINI